MVSDKAQGQGKVEGEREVDWWGVRGDSGSDVVASTLRQQVSMLVRFCGGWVADSRLNIACDWAATSPIVR